MEGCTDGEDCAGMKCCLRNEDCADGGSGTRMEGVGKFEPKL